MQKVDSQTLSYWRNVRGSPSAGPRSVILSRFSMAATLLSPEPLLLIIVNQQG